MIKERFGRRSQTIFRMALGLLVLSQPILLSRDFAVFYQSDGVFPLGSSDLSQPPFLSREAFVSVLHALIFWIIPVLACALVAGFFTRLATLGCFLSLIVVHNANADILQGGDVLLRLLLFWALFLPLGEVWSLDSGFKWLPRLSLPWTTALATWAFTLQVCFVYWFAALLKSDPLWTQNSNALFYALNIEHFTTPLGLYLRQFPDLLRVLTLATLCLEFIGPCLLLIPFYNDRFRLCAVILFLGFHLIGMESLLRIGLFPWVCAAAWLIFIPAFAWDWFKPKRKQSLPKKNSKARRVGEERVTSNSSGKWKWLDYSCSALVVISLLDVLAWNIASLRGPEAMQWMGEHDKFGGTWRLDQRWNMYAPYPRSEHGWLIVAADLNDGEQIDLFTGQTVSWDKPNDLGAYFGDDRWRRYLSNLFDNQDPQALQAYADYTVRNWNRNKAAGKQVQALTLYFMKEVTQPDLTVTPAEKDAIYFHAY